LPDVRIEERWRELRKRRGRIGCGFVRANRGCVAKRVRGDLGLCIAAYNGLEFSYRALALLVEVGILIGPPQKIYL
jgi:hypothetical protein